MASNQHMKLPLPGRSGTKSPRCNSLTPRSIGGQSPSEAYFNSNSGLLSPTTAYFEGAMSFFGPRGGASNEPPRTEQTAQDVSSPTPQKPNNSPVQQPQQQTQQMTQQIGLQQHSMPFVTYPPSSPPASTMPATTMPWPTGTNPPALTIPPAGPTLLQGAPSMIQKQPPPQKPQNVGRRQTGSDRAQTGRAACPAAVYVDLSSLREKK
mmetsp:Transcript_58739/g.110022  ORF Transcript_58739/g.110022 Transcript_58739/m.110022 type:complete len:208 (+) Transcript_58739:65-688(+)